MARIPGVACVGLSTNGSRLAVLASALREAGLRTVNISLDALNAQIYRRVTGGDLEHVLAGIRAAVAAGFECVKLNCVLMRGINEGEIWPLVLFAAEHELPLRLIELMPVTTPEALSEKNFHACERSHADAVRTRRIDAAAQPQAWLGAGEVLFAPAHRRARRFHRGNDRLPLL